MKQSKKKIITKQPSLIKSPRKYENAKRVECHVPKEEEDDVSPTLGSNQAKLVLRHCH